MKYLFIASTAILLFASASFAQGSASAEGCAGLDPKVMALVNEYKELRERRRRLPEGVYDKDLRDHGGRLHRVLSALGLELGRPPFTKKIIVACLGEPDKIQDDKRMGYFLDIYKRELKKAGRELKEKRGREYLIYYWRGGHDLMFFISEDGKIVDHGWWFAYE